MKYTHPHLEDVERIQFVLKKYRYNLGLKDCAEIWQRVSEHDGAEWEQLPKSEDILFTLLKLNM